MESYILQMESIRKTFDNGKIIANDNMNLKITKGEKHAIVGENGAGKSTLMKILNGLYRPTSGNIIYKGEKVYITEPGIASKLGIGMVYQHFMLIPTLTVAENMILGVEPKNGIFLDLNTARKEVKRVSKEYGLEINPDSYIKDLSLGMQQRVEILKILFKGAELLIFDEPTAVLIPQEINELYGIMNNLIKQGKTIIFISHKLEEVLSISDNITVIRRGNDVANFETAKVTKEEIAKAMVGREVLFRTEFPNVKLGEKVLEIKNLSVKDKNGTLKVNNVSFDINEGEVLGIAGVEGSGQSELIEALTGLIKIESGEIILRKKYLHKLKKIMQVEEKIAHIPEDRHKRAGISELSVVENFILGDHRKKYRKKYGILDFEKCLIEVKKCIEKYDIRPGKPEQEFGKLSGGNQQKVILARELERENILIIAAHPTRGVDIGAIEAIHKMILEEKKKKKAILIISSELSEIINLSDRVAVMCNGRISGILNRNEATEEKIGILMVGEKLD